jgi:hypothetical protein
VPSGGRSGVESSEARRLPCSAVERWQSHAFGMGTGGDTSTPTWHKVLVNAVIVQVKSSQIIVSR